MNRTDIITTIEDNEDFDDITAFDMDRIVAACETTQQLTGSLDPQEVLDLAAELTD